MTRKVVRDKRDLREVSVMLTDSDVYCMDIETVDRGYPDTKLTGVGVGCEKDGMYAARYIPIAHKKGLQLPLELVMEVLVDGVNSSNKMAVFHNAKYDIKILRLIARKLGLEQFDFRPDNVYCTMLASWFLDTENPHGLKELGERCLDILMTELDEFCEFVRHPKTNDKVYLTDETDIDVMAEYGYDDVIVPLKLKNIFDPEIEKEGFEKPMYDLKMPEMFELMDMEETGVFIDQKELDRVIETAPEMLEEVKKKIFELRPGGKEFNPNSPQQLAGVLFEEIGVNPIGEKGASGHYSTKKDYLEKWAAQGYEICEKVIDYRQVSKLLGTFAEGIKNRLWKDGRLRTRYNQIIRTGRTSSRKPNLQNIPRPSNDRFNLRGLFVAPEGKKLMAADYSQIELRVLAHLSQDPKFIEAYQNREDLHSFTAKELFDLDCPVSEVKERHPEIRAKAKEFNFAMVYEAGIDTLAQNAGIKRSEAKAARSKYFARFRGIKNFINWSHQKARTDGYIRTITGRKRHLEPATITNPKNRYEHMMQGKYERKAVNSQVQGSAADVMALGMRDLSNALKKKGMREQVNFVLQVHDEIVLELPDDEEFERELEKIVKEELEDVVDLRVPIEIEYAVADSWDKAK